MPYDPRREQHWADAARVADYASALPEEGTRVLDFGPGDGWPALPLAATLPLRPALSLTSRIVAVKGMRPGEGAGYGLRWRADGPHTIAIVLAEVLNVAWMTWLLVIAWRMPESKPSPMKASVASTPPAIRWPSDPPTCAPARPSQSKLDLAHADLLHDDRHEQQHAGRQGDRTPGHDRDRAARRAHPRRHTIPRGRSGWSVL